MRDPTRIDPMVTKVKEIWEKCPDLRFGQLIYMLYLEYDVEMNRLPADRQPSLYLTEDTEFMAWLKTFKGLGERDE